MRSKSLDTDFTDYTDGRGDSFFKHEGDEGKTFVCTSWPLCLVFICVFRVLSGYNHQNNI